MLHLNCFWIITRVITVKLMTLSHEPKQTKKCRKNLTEDMQTWIPPLWKEIDPINAENSIAKESYSFIEKMHLAIRTLLTCYVNGSHVNNLHYQDDLIPTFLHHQKVPLQYPVWSADWNVKERTKESETRIHTKEKFLANS